MTQVNNSLSVKYPHIIRRLGASIYDSLLLVAVWFVATALLLPFTQRAVPAGHPLFIGYLMMIWLGFYSGFWVYGGQTLGMRAWCIRVQQLEGAPLRWPQAVIRFIVMQSWLLPTVCIGSVIHDGHVMLLTAGVSGLLIMLIHPQDGFSNSTLVYYPKFQKVTKSTDNRK